MKVLTLIKYCCQYVEDNELLTKLNSVGAVVLENPIFDDRDKDKLKRYLRCFNAVNCELADYNLFRASRDLAVSDGKFNTVIFGVNGFKFLSIRDEKDKKLKFKTFVDTCELEPKISGTIHIEYAYTPPDADYNSDLGYGVTWRVVLYGMLREYYLEQGLAEEASIYETRFKDGLQLYLKKVHHFPAPFIKGRRWL